MSHTAALDRYLADTLSLVALIGIFFGPFLAIKAFQALERWTRPRYPRVILLVLLLGASGRSNSEVDNGVTRLPHHPVLPPDYCLPSVNDADSAYDGPDGRPAEVTPVSWPEFRDGGWHWWCNVPWPLDRPVGDPGEPTRDGQDVVDELEEIFDEVALGAPFDTGTNFPDWDMAPDVIGVYIRMAGLLEDVPDPGLLVSA